MNKLKLFLTALPVHFLSGLTLALVLWLTLAPDPLGEDKPDLFEGADKVVHAIMFGWLAAMLLLDRSRTRNWQPLKWGYACQAALFSSAAGITIEFLQRWMAMGRGFDPLDMCADTAGAILFACVYMWLQPSWCNPL